MVENNVELIGEQIDAIQQEALLIRFVFALANSVGLVFFGFVVNKIISNPDTLTEGYGSLLQAVAALFAPYLTIVSQGFCFPKMRRINSLMHLFWKAEIDGAEVEILYDK